MRTESRTVLLNIARCANVEQHYAAGDQSNPCAAVIDSQAAATLSSFQVSEPWSGQLASAPVLFLSSNPSISEVEAYPTWEWSDDQIVDFFDNRFGSGEREWVANGTRALLADGSHGSVTRFWISVRQRAVEVLGRTATPGVDYALTEIVHCKSRAERGVKEAWRECARRHLRPVLSISAARVIVGLGAFAKEVLRSEFQIATEGHLHGPLDLAGRSRMVVTLPHPASFAKAKTLAKCLSVDELLRMQKFVRGES